MSQALLIVDVQNDYFPGGRMELRGSVETGERIKLVLEQFRKTGKPILHVRHIAVKPGATFFLLGTAGSEIHPCATPLADETVFVKHYPNSFRETGLHEHCRAQGITELVIVGMMTHMCIDTSTRAAFDLGYTCTVMADCCATMDLRYRDDTIAAASVQASFLAALDGSFCTVTSSEDFLRD